MRYQFGGLYLEGLIHGGAHDFRNFTVFLLVRSFVDPTFCGIFVCGPLQLKIPYPLNVRDKKCKIRGVFL